MKSLIRKAFMEVTTGCNQDCEHCNIERALRQDPEIMSYQLARKVIEELARLGCFHLVLTGGEPMLHPDIGRIIKIAAEYNFRLVVCTNATQRMELLCTPAIAEKVDFVLVSLCGWDAYSHDSVTRCPGSYQKTLSAIRLLRSHGIKVVANVVLKRGMLPHLPKFRSLAAREGLILNIDPGIHRTVYTHDPGPMRFAPTDEELEDFFKLSEEEVNEASSWEPSCGCGISKVFIGASGHVFPCETLRVACGDLKTQRLEDIWEHSPLLVRLRNLCLEDFPECKVCPIVHSCSSHCLGIALMESGSIFGRPTSACRIAFAKEYAKARRRETRDFDVFAGGQVAESSAGFRGRSEQSDQAPRVG